MLDGRAGDKLVLPEETCKLQCPHYYSDLEGYLSCHALSMYTILGTSGHNVTQTISQNILHQVTLIHKGYMKSIIIFQVHSDYYLGHIVLSVYPQHNLWELALHMRAVYHQDPLLHTNPSYMHNRLSCNQCTLDIF